MRLKCKKNSMVLILTIILCACVSVAVVNFQYDEITYQILGVIWAFVLIASGMFVLGKIEATSSIKVIIFVGYVSHIMFSIYAYYAMLCGDYLKTDQYQFAVVSRGEFSRALGVNTLSERSQMWGYRQSFTTLLKQMYFVIGNSDLAVRMIQLLLWCLALYIIVKSMQIRLAGRKHEVLVALYCFMPVEFFYHCLIMREVYISFLLVIFLLLLWRWMEYGKISSLVLAVAALVPACRLQGGNIAMIGVAVVSYCFWDVRSQRWLPRKINAKYLVLFGVIMLFPLELKILSFAFPGKFRSLTSVNSIIPEINRNIRIALNAGANSNYMPDIQIGSINELLYWTIYKFFYFWFSPTPRFWTSLKQMAGFFYDSIVWISLMIYTLTGIKRKKIDKKATVIIFMWFFMGVCFGLGTNNAGTAMRHRGELLWPFIMCALLPLKNKSVCRSSDDKPIGFVTERKERDVL